MTQPEGIINHLEANGQVVLLDMKLQNSNGLDVLREIKAQYPNMPVILITGYRDEVSPAIETALQLSAYTYFYKPLQIEDLLLTLTQIPHQELGRMLGRVIEKKKHQLLG